MSFQLDNVRSIKGKKKKIQLICRITDSYWDEHLVQKHTKMYFNKLEKGSLYFLKKIFKVIVNLCLYLFVCLSVLAEIVYNLMLC